MSGLGSRLRMVRELLGETQRGMSERFALGINTWQVYERMDRLPKDQALIELVGLGVSIDWLITGKGEMRRDPPLTNGAALPTMIDVPLLSQVVDAVLGIYGAPPQPSTALPRPGDVIGRIYVRLIGMRDEGERRGALRYALDQLLEDVARHRRAGT